VTTSRNLLAVIPAYNEAAHVGQIVRQTLREMSVLVVDDGSSDQTAALAEAAGAEVLRQSPNQGKGAALRAGFARALELGCEAVLTLDADGQHDPADIRQFLEAYDTGRADLIIGRRDFSRMPFSRRLANTMGRWLFSQAMGQPIPDNQSGFRLLSSRFIRALLNSTERGFEFEVEMLVNCVTQGYNLEWVDIRTLYAGETSHIRPLAHTRRFLRMVRDTRRRVRETG